MKNGMDLWNTLSKAVEAPHTETIILPQRWWEATYVEWLPVGATGPSDHQPTLAHLHTRRFWAK